MVRSIVHDTTLVAGLLVLLTGVVGCGGEDRGQVSVELFGWVSSEDGGDFTPGMPAYEGGDEVQVRVTRPGEGEVVNEQTVDIDRRQSRMPEVPGGPGLRMEFEVRGDGQPIATGATPTFGIEGGDDYGFRTMISPVDEFAPAGSRRRDPETGEYRIVESTFDIRQYGDDIEWSGRVGHTAHQTESGEILVVGGARVVSVDSEPGSAPVIRETFNDIQLFDPSTGYFTELAGDSASRERNAEGEDRLEESRVFHTVTPLGDDRFLVVGGFQSEGGDTVPVDAIELIDLNAPAGERVQRLDGVESLDDARGHHTATYRESDGNVVVAGGLGSGQPVSTIEIIDPDSPDIQSGISMQTSRANHEAILLEDGETVWVIGGTDGDSPLGSTEVIGGDNVPANGPSLDTPRHGATAVHLGEQGNNQVVVFGGLGSGGAEASYEMGNPLQGGGLESGDGWELNQARAGAEAMVLPQSGDVLVVGGYDENTEAVGTAERLSLNLQELPPFEVESGFGGMHHLRADAAVAPVTNGRILVVGGEGSEGNARNDAEYFNPYDPVEP